MRESEKTEFKRTFVGDLNKEVIAFANCDGGEIFVGIDDDGGVCGVDDINDMQLRCTAHIKNTIRPDIMNFVRVEPVVVDGKNVLKIIVCRGSAAPYYIAGKGIRPEGVYVRRGTASSPATQTEILNMIRDTSVAYEDMRSIEQNLTFVRAGQEFDRAGLPFGDAQKRSLGIVGADGCFTNLGYCPINARKTSSLRSSMGMKKRCFATVTSSEARFSGKSRIRCARSTYTTVKAVPRRTGFCAKTAETIPKRRSERRFSTPLYIGIMRWAATR